MNRDNNLIIEINHISFNIFDPVKYLNSAFLRMAMNMYSKMDSRWGRDVVEDYVKG